MAELNMATAGRFGILKQTAQGTIQSNDANFHYFAFSACGYGPQQAQAALPIEAGDIRPLPGGHYKTGLMFAGTVTMIPRLENRIAYLLEAAIGDISTVGADQTIDQKIAASGSNTGVHVHQFLYLYDATGAGTNWQLPYLTTHRFLPSQSDSTDVGEISQDACVSLLQLNAGAGGIASANVGMVGRGFDGTIWDLNPSWSAPTLDDPDSFLATACTGFVKVAFTDGTPGTVTTQNVTGLRLSFINNLYPPARARIVGSPFHVDHPNLGRNTILEIPQLVSDYDTYMQVFSGAQNPVADGGFSCVPLSGDVDVELQSPMEIAGAASTAYYTFRFRTTQGNAKFTVDPVALVAGQPVVYNLRAEIARVTSGLPFECYIQNDQAAY